MSLTLLLAGVALGAELGGGLAVVAVRDSAGAFDLRPAISTSLRAVGGGAVWGDLTLVGALPTQDEGIAWAHSQAWLRASAALGLQAGTLPARFRVFAGPAVTLQRTTWSEPQSVVVEQVLPGARYGLGLAVPVGDRGYLDGSAGGSLRGVSRDYELCLGGGLSW